MEQWHSDGGTVWWNSGKVIVEQCGGKEKQCWLNSGTVLVEKWHSNGGTVWWNNETVIVEQCGGKVEQCW